MSLTKIYLAVPDNLSDDDVNTLLGEHLDDGLYGVEEKDKRVGWMKKIMYKKKSESEDIERFALKEDEPQIYIDVPKIWVHDWENCEFTFTLNSDPTIHYVPLYEEEKSGD